MESYFEKVVQIFELKRVGGAPKGHPFAPQSHDSLHQLEASFTVKIQFQHMMMCNNSFALFQSTTATSVFL